MAISSPGLGSGLDVNSIVSQMVKLESQPLVQLQAKASEISTRITQVGKIQSQISTLQSAAAKLASASGWSSQTATSSNADAVNVTPGTGAASGKYSITVSQLAKAESAVSGKVAANSAVGGGSLSISVGGGDAVEVTIAADSTLSDIANAINNKSGVGISASVVRDGLGEEQLIFKSKTTGTAGFAVNVTDDGGGGLSQLQYDSFGGGAMTTLQTGQNALLEIDGLQIESSSNNTSDILPGLTLNLKQVTTDPIEISVETDNTQIKDNINAFVKAYNDLSDLLKSSLKYDETTKKAGALQGDAITNGIQSTLRSILGSSTTGSTLARLSDAGIEIGKTGTLSVNTTKLDAALTDKANIQNLFGADTGSSSTDGIARKFDTFTSSLLDFDGALANKTESLQNSQKRNERDQDKVSERLSLVETRLRRQYAALDGKMGSMQALGSYISQQVASWNNS